MSWVDEFLAEEQEPVPWATGGLPAGITPQVVFFQPTDNGLEVVLAEAPNRPSMTQIREAWSKRRSGRASPVLLVVGYPTGDDTRVSVCGPIGDRPSVHHNLEVSQVERLAEVGLSEPSHHAATRFLLTSLPEVDTDMAGLRNTGLLATHELKTGVPLRGDWLSATDRSKPLLGLRGQALVEALGYTVKPLNTNASVLTVNGDNRAVAVFCDDHEPFDAPSARFGTSPVSAALAAATKEDIDWVVLTRARELRLYAARADTGVGRRGRAETFVEVNLALLPTDRAGYLHLLFSSEALATGGTIDEVLETSAVFAADLAERLRERVYFEAVPTLAQAVAKRMPDRPNGPSQSDLDHAYQQVLVILFRLLFVAYAEDKDLLPTRTNSDYAEHSLTQLAQDRVKARAEGTNPPRADSTALWHRIERLWRAVDAGNPGWGVPAYNGGLFSSDPEVSPVGTDLGRISLNDEEFAPALDAILINQSLEGEGPVDFRSLSVREFGTIYEGLLESNLSVAQDDLTAKSDAYVPAGDNDQVVVAAGEVYLHNRSGARKSTGSYFTKPFAVEHLLDHALEPALDNHVERLNQLRDQGDEAGLAAGFFDFRCADLAMGSAHFLVAAVDRIEAKLSTYLAQNPIPAVKRELERLQEKAYEALGELRDGVEIETSSLLRRQIARHCIYGIDLQPVAVELARLGIWVHTFVPGLPLSFLDHNLVCGNSLTGVSTLNNVMTTIDPDADPDTPNLFRNQVEGLLGQAGQALHRLARTSDATKREIDQAREAQVEAQQAVAAAIALFDLVSAHRAGAAQLPEDFDETIFVKQRSQPAVKNALDWLKPVHYPAAFPEVFLRQNPGFDCLLGNPPWEAVVADERVWWGTHLPGIRSLPVGKMNAAIAHLRATRPDLEDEFQDALDHAEQMRTVLRATYPQLGSGKTDLYKAFCWRTWQLIRQEGTAGVVLPRTALQTKGSEQWRKTVLDEGTFLNITTLENTKGWVFDDVDSRYVVALIGLHKINQADKTLSISGPYRSPHSYRTTGKPERVPVGEFMSWSDDASFPQLPEHPGALRLFSKLRSHPRYDGQTSQSSPESRVQSPESRVQSRPRPVQGDCNATTDKHRFILDSGNSARTGSWTPPPTSTDSSSTVATPPGGRTPRHRGQTPTHPWRSRERERERERERASWPVYQGRSFNLWQPDTGSYYASVDSATITAHLYQKRLSQHRKSTSAFSELDPEVINDRATLPCWHPRIAFRNITNPTNARTIIAALVPGKIVIQNQAPYLLRVSGTAQDEAYLLGALSSMVLDWYARRTVELSLNFYLFNNFPIPDADHHPTTGDPVAQRVVEVSGRLAAVDERYRQWADDVGVPVGSVTDEATKNDLIYELDACVAHLYGLDEDDLGVLYTTFDEKRPNRYADHHAAVLTHFRRWQ